MRERSNIPRLKLGLFLITASFGFAKYQMDSILTIDMTKLDYFNLLKWVESEMLGHFFSALGGQRVDKRIFLLIYLASQSCRLLGYPVSGSLIPGCQFSNE